MTKEEAIEVYNGLINTKIREAFEFFAPELKESEDEKIREEIITYLSTVEDKELIPYESWIAWLEKQEEDTYDYKRVDLDKFDERIREFSDMLEDKPKPYWDGWYEAMDWIRVNGTPFEDEKQGEQKPIKEHNVCNTCDEQAGCVNPCPMKLVEKQKPADKAEPKFKVGDWIFTEQIDNIVNGPYKIKEVNDDYGYVLDGIRETTLPFTSEHCMRLWTIQDAKPGDVLVSGETIILVSNSAHAIDSACAYIGEEDIFVDYKQVGYNGDTWHPADQKERDLLFQKMKEAGYEWDAEKKELKKIEQKPAEKPVWYDNMDDLIAERMIDEIQKSDLPEGSKHNRIYWINKHRVQPKQEWSEEDERNLNDAILFIETGTYSLDKDNLINWLKSLRPQNRCGWNDMSVKPIYPCDILYQQPNGNMFIYRYIEGGRANDAQTPTFCNLDENGKWIYLKDVKPQNTWKPSDEQMGVIEAVINNRSFQRRHLDSLYEQLKKLREE